MSYSTIKYIKVNIVNKKGKIKYNAKNLFKMALLIENLS